MSWTPDLESWVLSLEPLVSCPGSHPQDGSRVSGLGFQQKPQVSGPTFRICPFLHIKVDYIFMAAVITVLSGFIYFQMFHLLLFWRIDFVGLAISVHTHFIDEIIATYIQLLKVFIIINKIFCNILFFLPLFRMGLFGAAHGWGRGGGHTYPTMMKLGTVILFLKKIRKTYKSRDTLSKFCSYQHFFTGNHWFLLYTVIDCILIRNF